MSKVNRILLVIGIVYLQGSFFFGSCQKPQEPGELPDMPGTFPTNLEVLWNAIFHSDGEGDFFWNYEIANDKYIVLANTYDSDGGIRVK